MILGFLFSVYIIVTLFYSVYRPKTGVAMYLTYFILVPYIGVHISGINIGWLAVNILFLFSFILNYKIIRKRSIKIKPVLPFITYYILVLATMPFQHSVPLDYMLEAWLRDIMTTLIIPIVMWNVISYRLSVLKLFRHIIVVCIFIAAAYGLFLTTTGGVNPYQMFIAQISDIDYSYYENYYESAIQGGRLFGRISSVFLHPMSFALFIGLSIIYIYYIREKLSQYVYLVLIGILALNCITCGVRSVIGALGVTSIYYLLTRRSFKIIFTSFFILIAGVLIIQNIPELSSYIGSIADIHNKTSSVSGSSIEMRLTQLEGSIEEAGKNPIFGHGYKWNTYYGEHYDVHPVILAFESLLFIIICNHGLSGFLIWGCLIYMILNNNKSINPSERPIFNCLLIFYLVFSIVTGEYGYMKYYILFYILMLGECFYTKVQESHQSHQ